MQTIHLTEYHLGGAPQGGAASESATPSPQLPDAGRPYVESVSYDKDAKKVRLRAQNARAGEVKTPLGDWQEFPVDVPEPTPLPDAGKPFVEGVTYDPDTKNVKVRAKVAQAGEVKDPIGEEQEFPIHVPTPPAPPAPTLPDAGKPRVSKFNYDSTTRKVTVQASVAQTGEVKTPLGDEQTFDIPAEAAFTGIVHKYNVKNNNPRGPIEVTTGTGNAPTVNGVSVPLSANIARGASATIFSPVAKFELNAPLGGGSFSVNYYKLSLGEAVTLSRTTEGYLLIEREVVVTL